MLLAREEYGSAIRKRRQSQSHGVRPASRNSEQSNTRRSAGDRRLSFAIPVALLWAGLVAREPCELSVRSKYGLRLW